MAASVKELQKGPSIGDMTISGAGAPGQFVYMTTTDKTVIVSAAATANHIGMLLDNEQITSTVNTYATGKKVALAYGEGVYEVDSTGFTFAGLAVGDNLMFPDASGVIGKFVTGAGNTCIGQVLALSATTLRFKMKIEATRT